MLTPLVLHFFDGKKEIVDIIGMLISKFIPFFVVLFIHLKKQSELLKKFKKNYICIFLFPISTVFIVTLQHVVFFEYPVQSKVTSYAVLVAYSFLILANIVVFDFIDSLYQNTIAESEIAAAKELIDSQRLRYQELLEHNRDIMKLQHDSRNFYIGLISELRDGKTDLAIEHLCSALENYDDREITGKTIVDTIVYSKRCTALKKNINITFEVGNLGEEITIPATDLAIMFGNALDNAIEECERIVGSSKKDITVFITMKCDNVIIIIKNPTSRDIDPKNLSTGKSNSENHGFGVTAMRRIAEKYSGDVLFAYDKRVFTTAIIFNNSMNISGK